MAVHRHFGKYLALAGTLFLGVGFIAPTSAAAGPPGNNGTVKIGDAAVDDYDPGPNNQPHVDCSFYVDFYNYEGPLDVVMTFETQSPTGDGGELLLVQEETLDDDDASGANEAGRDGHFLVDLSEELAGYTPQENQGYHVKITVDVPDATGPDAVVKHKVFWVGPCEPPTTTSTTSTTSSTTSTTAALETTSTTASVQNTQVTQTPTTPTTAAPTEVLGVQLVRTGFSSTMLVLGTSLLVLGLVFELLTRAALRRAS